MVKKIIALFFVLFLTSSISAQNVYYDAISISKSVAGDSLSTENVQALMNYFNIHLELNDDNIDEIVAELEIGLEENPFLLFLSEMDIGDAFKGIDLPAIPKIKTGGISSLTGLNITTIADGAARFLIERSKEELTITFFERFKDHLKEGSDLHTLFPQTAGFIKQFESYEYSSMLNAIREAFIQDLNKLPESIPDLSEKEAYQAQFRTNAGRLLLASMELINPIKNGNDLATVLEIASESEQLSLLSSDNHSVKNIQPSLIFLNLISQSLLSNEDDKVWVSYSQINELLEDSITFRIYMGLLYEQFRNENIEFVKRNGEKVNLVELIDDSEQKLNQLDGFYRDLNKELQSLNNTYSVLVNKTKSGDKAQPEAIFNYADDILDLISSVNELPTTLGFADISSPKEDFDKFLALSKSANRFATNIAQKNYSAAIVEVYMLLDNDDLNIQLNRNLLKYGTFIAAVAEAENSDEVKIAIETAVLPAGSSRIKRQTNHNISINAYLGGFGGFEHLREVPPSENEGYFTFGVSAPVGIAFSWGLKSVCECEQTTSNSSLSLFISIIDIGAFASYRLQGDDIEDLPDFTLQNIIAPGAFLSWNIGKSPLTFSVGGQLGPQLRTIRDTIDESEVLTSSAWRLQASLTVDIPLFNIKTVPWD